MDLGRFQLGQQVPLAIETATAPDAAPTATIAPPGGQPGTPFKLAMLEVSTAWRLPVFLGVGVALGTYSVSYSYSIAGVAHTRADTYEVIAGGDPAGGIISMFAYDRPEARYVVAQTVSGRLMQGRNPRLS